MICWSTRTSTVRISYASKFSFGNPLKSSLEKREDDCSSRRCRRLLPKVHPFKLATGAQN